MLDWVKENPIKSSLIALAVLLIVVLLIVMLNDSFENFAYRRPRFRRRYRAPFYRRRRYWGWRPRWWSSGPYCRTFYNPYGPNYEVCTLR